MKKYFWHELNKPILALAPMADVTDPAFRRVIAKYGKPDVIFTEFVAADGLCHPVGRKRLLLDLSFTEVERPIVAQLFGGNPASILQATELVTALGFDGVDINMGCPHRVVEKQGGGAALIRRPELAREIIRAAKEGTGGRIPVSVKTRLGYNRDELETWLPELLAEEPVALTLHARTRKEMSKAPARWERVRRAVEIRDQIGSAALILGNGDVADPAEARSRAKETGADGVMLGRAIFGNPWLFAERESGPLPEEKLRVLMEQAELFEKLFRGVKSFAIMKKHFKAYVQDFAGASDLRIKLMETENANQMAEVIKGFKPGIA